MAKNKDDFIPPNYNEDIDFQELALSNKDFNDCLRSNKGRFDWQNAEHLRILTKALLLRDFSLEIFLPKDRLCPPVPIRWLYVQWIQNLLGSTSPRSVTPDALHEVTGLDIGVGASSIYPLLAVASRPQWKIYGTDIDDSNFLHAVHNVSANELDNQIKIILTTSEGPLIPLEELGVPRLDFTMCNPPFFASKEEADATHEKEDSPFATCTGAEVEMITPGGEVAYVSRMIDESLKLQTKVQWYTVQLGKYNSTHPLVDKLKHLDCKNWVLHMLETKGRTRRWVFGWSWMDFRAPDALARPARGGMAPKPNETLVKTNEGYEDKIKTLPLRYEETKDFIKISTQDPVWKRHLRRKRQREEAAKTSATAGNNSMIVDEILEEKTTHIFTVTKVPDDSVKGYGKLALKVRWVKGDDHDIYESFCDFLRARPPANVKDVEEAVGPRAKME